MKNVAKGLPFLP
jgi:hypothetical protein